jgi:CheY-like chemotaxis protein
VARILLIDDDELIRVALRVALERAGHQVEEAEDGPTGVARYAELRPDVVVTDIVMPRQSGIDIIAQIRAMSPAVPVVVISGGDDAGHRSLLAAAERKGASRVLAKPFRPQALVDAIDDLLAPAA